MKELLKDIPDIQIDLGKDLTNFSTMKLRAKGDLITVKNISALKSTVKVLTEQRVGYTVLGWGANSPLPEESRVPYLKLDFPFDSQVLKSVSKTYVLPASLSLGRLSTAAMKLNLKGWEVLTGIPATLGGAVAMNAGTKYGDIGPLVTKVWYVDSDGNEKVKSVGLEDFTYRKNLFLGRGDVIFQVEMKHYGIDPQVSARIKEYLELRKRTQPLDKLTCGCAFKNQVKASGTCRAGQFIDIMGLKGFQYKGLRISPVHANFIENIGGATLSDLREFLEIIEDEIELNFGFKFEREIRV